jgi:hypothetical protein
MSMISGETPLGGQMGERIEHLRERFRGLTVAERSRDIAWIIEESDLSIHACEWGWCVYRKETSRCEGGNKGPDQAKRGPSICAGCANLSVDEAHRPYWQSRRNRNAALLAQLDLAPPLKRVLPAERVAESERILKQLDGTGTVSPNG